MQQEANVGALGPQGGGVEDLSQAGLKDESHPWQTPGPPLKLAFEKKNEHEGILSTEGEVCS